MNSFDLVSIIPTVVFSEITYPDWHVKVNSSNLRGICKHFGSINENPESIRFVFA